VLATTEANKVLPTVVDRCHRFDFKRPTAEAGLGRACAGFASAEGHRGRARGRRADRPPTRRASFRDALGTLEQLVTYSGLEHRARGTSSPSSAWADADLLFGALDAIASGDPRAALLAAEQAQRGPGRGRLPVPARPSRATRARPASSSARWTATCRASLSVSPERDARLAEQGLARPRASPSSGLLDLLAAGMEAVKAGADARTQLELALVKARLARRRPLYAGAAGRASSSSRPPCAETPRPRPRPAGAADRPGAATRGGPPAHHRPRPADAPAAGPPRGGVEEIAELWPAVLDDVPRPRHGHGRRGARGTPVRSSCAATSW